MNSFILSPSIQSIAGILSLIGGTLVFIVVIFLIRSSSQYEDAKTAKNKVYGIRSRYLWGLIAIVVVLLVVSLQMVPYERSGARADQVVFIAGAQWVWKMAPGEYSGKIEDFTGGNELELSVDQNIKFIVTSSDVNHGFAIYNDRGELLTQTQAMPGYKNELMYKFREKGDYTILCLEYCGLAHANMKATLHIQ